jgi:hypothetical protein
VDDDLQQQDLLAALTMKMSDSRWSLQAVVLRFVRFTLAAEVLFQMM